MIDDLKYANAAGVYVELVLLTGEKLLTDVREVREDENIVTVGNPKTFEDDGTTRKILIDTIISVSVTDMSI
jgi:hypothetical protein